MKYKRLVYFLFVTLLSVPSLAQDEPIDSIRTALQSLPEDSVKVNTLVALSKAYLGTDPREALQYGLEAKKLAIKVGFPKGAAFAAKSMGQAYTMQANFAEAIAQFQVSLHVFDSIHNKSGVANMLSNIGACYFNISDDTKAIEFYLKSLRVSEEINDRLRIGTSILNIGAVYQNKAATLDKALAYFSNAIKIFKEIRYTEGIGMASMNIGEIYERREQYDSAISYYDASLEIYSGTVDATFPLTHIGEINAKKGNYEQALLYQNKALEIATKLDAKFEITQSLLGIGKTQQKRGSLTLSISNYLQAVKLAEEIGARNELKLAYEGLAHAYSILGDFKKAYTYETLFSTIKDTLYNTANDNSNCNSILTSKRNNHKLTC